MVVCRHLWWTGEASWHWATCPGCASWVRLPKTLALNLFVCVCVGHCSFSFMLGRRWRAEAAPILHIAPLIHPKSPVCLEGFDIGNCLTNSLKPKTLSLQSNPLYPMLYDMLLINMSCWFEKQKNVSSSQLCTFFRTNTTHAHKRPRLNDPAVCV